MRPRADPPGGSRAAIPAAGVGRASHRFLEHTGELALELRAESLADLLAEAGRALGALALRGRIRRADGPWRDVTVASADRTALLVDWLNELIYQAEARSEVPTEFEILGADDGQVRARFRGVVVEQPPALVKAATLHGASVERGERGFEGHVVLDV